MEAFAVSVQPLLVDAGSLVGLQQLDHDGSHMRLGPDHREVRSLAMEIRVMKRGRLVLVHVPGTPPQRSVITLEGLVDVADDDRDLADRKSASGTTIAFDCPLCVAISAS